jgi:hypothetical protein
MEPSVNRARTSQVSFGLAIAMGLPRDELFRVAEVLDCREVVTVLAIPSRQIVVITPK